MKSHRVSQTNSVGMNVFTLDQMDVPIYLDYLSLPSSLFRRESLRKSLCLGGGNYLHSWSNEMDEKIYQIKSWCLRLEIVLTECLFRLTNTKGKFIRYNIECFALGLENKDQIILKMRKSLKNNDAIIFTFLVQTKTNNRLAALMMLKKL